MSYSILLLAHIGIASASLPLLVTLGIQLIRRTATAWFTNLVFASNLLTVFTGVALMFAGADITRTCITLGAYTVVAMTLFVIANKQGVMHPSFNFGLLRNRIRD